MESTGKQTLSILQTCNKDKRRAMVSAYILCANKYTYLHICIYTYTDIDIYIPVHVLSHAQYMRRHSEINPKGASDLCWRPHIPEAGL